MNRLILPLLFWLIVGLYGKAEEPAAPESQSAGNDDVAPAPANDGWLDDIDASLKRAELDKRDVLLIFTQTQPKPNEGLARWTEAMFTGEAFTKMAAPHFVLVRVELAESQEQPDELKRRNSDWRTRLVSKNSGFPRALVLDAKGRPVGSELGYVNDGDVSAYWGRIEPYVAIRRKRDDCFDKAEQAQGLEKAKLLDEGLSQLHRRLVVDFYADRVKEIMNADSDNNAGLKTKYLAIQRLAAIEGIPGRGPLPASQIAREVDRAIQELNLTSEIAQEFLFLKARMLHRHNPAAARDAYSAAIESAPDSKLAAQIKGLLKSLPEKK